MLTLLNEFAEGTEAERPIETRELHTKEVKTM